MAVSKEIKHLEKSNVSLSFTIPKEDIQAKYREMLKEYSKNVQIHGFRKGKVPQEVLELKFGDALKNDALARIIESAMQEAFEDESLNKKERPLPYSMPELQGEPKLDFDQDLQFSVVYDVLPEVKIGQWKGLNVEVPYAEIGDEDINLELEEIRERNSVVMDRDDDAVAQKGDFITIDYDVFDKNGNEKENRKDFVFTLGAGKFIYNLDDDITGMKKGETKEIEKTYSENNEDKYLSGETFKFKVLLKEIKEKKLPDLDDDLAQDVDEKFETLNDLKNNIKEKLNKNLEWKSRDRKISELLRKIMENTPVILPDSMVRAEIEGRWRRLARMYNMDVENLMRVMAVNEKREEREREWREAAEIALHSRIIMETLIDEQKIEVSAGDVEKEFERMASVNGVSIEDIKKNYTEENIFYLKEDIKEKRVTDIMLAENTIRPGKKEKYLDFMSDNG
ncbi:MAG: trigger factor [Treponema sp.]|nr:trigger factor [Treponema sp.]